MHDAYAVPFEGIASLLEELRSAQVPVAVVTGKGSRSAISLKVLGLEQYFTLIKPSSAQVPSKDVAILEVLKEWGLMPGEAIYIGDAPTDVLVARKVGCCVASVCWASTAQANVLEPLHPDTVVHTVAAAEAGHLIVSTRKSKQEDQEAKDRGARKAEIF